MKNFCFPNAIVNPYTEQIIFEHVYFSNEDEDVMIIFLNEGIHSHPQLPGFSYHITRIARLELADQYIEDQSICLFAARLSDLEEDS